MDVLRLGGIIASKSVHVAGCLGAVRKVGEGKGEMWIIQWKDGIFGSGEEGWGRKGRDVDHSMEGWDIWER